MNTVTALVLVGVAVALWYWFSSRGGAQGSAESQLRRICHGNDAQAERLIEGEMSRTPGISRGEAAARAVARYRRDNR